jgi:hypothetical protein
MDTLRRLDRRLVKESNRGRARSDLGTVGGESYFRNGRGPRVACYRKLSVGCACTFQAAAGYAILAVGTGLAGRALAGGKDRGKSSRGGSYSYSSAPAINQNPTPYTRASQDAYISGSRTAPSDPAIAKLADAVDNLHSKIDSMPAGEVLTTGMRQKRGIIGQQVINDFKSNASLTTQLRRVSGGR